MAFTTFAMLGKHLIYLVPRHFHYPKRKACSHQAVTLHAPLSRHLETISLLSVSINLPILVVSYKWNYTM